MGLLPKKVKSLESIQSTFTTAIADLKALQARNDDIIVHINASIDQLEAEREETAEENSKAAKFQQNLENLLK